MSYWSGAVRRVIPALLVGVVVGLVCLLVWDPTAALVVGGATFLAATLLPVKQPKR
ncbi:hypothetical protein [Blastococcus haudaquaticus]|uniref:hypothetical protein n=1 Tax=Blastococcus haudaquaticus TaxID=1938745 RepID=UPI0013583745|nr:hypothetical protein [Blastococcus haudaquaticus]